MLGKHRKHRFDIDDFIAWRSPPRSPRHFHVIELFPVIERNNLQATFKQQGDDGIRVWQRPCLQLRAIGYHVLDDVGGRALV